MHCSATALPPPPRLAELHARQRVALFLDFDGTLVDIAERPDAIEVPPELGGELARASSLLGGRLAVISGRSAESLRGYLREPPVLAGSHGSEIVMPDGTALSGERVKLGEGPSNAIRAFAAGLPALLLEEKPLGLALHYRSAPDLEQQLRAFADSLVKEHPVALKRGKCVVEFVVPGTSKARAVERLMTIAPFTDSVPVFVGDDETDEDGFAAAAALGGFGIAVGERPSRGASFRLESPAAVREWVLRAD
jgi:trehalose 6-phosphate phosphatase